ncbi:hypothetical protein ES705_17485 [subsurface metagenome]
MNVTMNLNQLKDFIDWIRRQDNPGKISEKQMRAYFKEKKIIKQKENKNKSLNRRLGEFL